jgi:hypothetical protein
MSLLYDLVEKVLSQIGTNPIARGDRENISRFETNYKNFKTRISKIPIDIESAITSAKNSAIHAQVVGAGINNREMYSNEAKSVAKDLTNVAIEFIKKIDAGEEFTGPYRIHPANIDPFLENTGSSISDHEKQIIELQAKIRSEIETFERDIAKGADEIEQLKQKSTTNYKTSTDEILELLRTVEQLKSNISSLHENMATESSKAAKISEDAAEHSKTVHSQIDELLGQTASKVLLVDYANTAEAEKKSANIMRNSSLACMALTGLVLCFALYESLNSPLDWKQSILKVFTAIALSVPAAYLARESAKHRNQEHINRRISLDLRAITPYIATLPNEEQNKIKSEVASKIFGIQENGNTPPDNYPINIQELAKLIIEKIPTSK